ncbi:ECF transporter S component [Candidatus Contubernalis alkaliaceticus]|uniref:ECF transporter S component n=1 Tax=Candidatus Contubernalis alkaliaceticus TaxID=338645 RepID=UPI001F4BFB0A|nr:ECF transporter S component [Candidatus Contubernalis alkalaceticus]UNC91957.1 ECF transporter S component [Candidatus Contubernalis alkalaceticus]
MKKGFLKKFSMFDLVIITMMAALGVAIKPIIVPLAHIITGPFFIPGGVIAGGFYMLWIVLGHGLVNKRGTGTLIGVIQAILVISMGIFGTHGAISIITYVAPGIMVDLLYIILRGGVNSPLNAFLGGVAANVTGTVLVTIVFFRLPLIPLLLSLSAASLSGGLGGLVAFRLIKQLQKFNIGVAP